MIPIQSPSRSDGYATLAIFAIVGLIMLFLASGVRILTDLRSEIRLIEQRQIERFNEKPLPLDTNPPPEVVDPENERAESSD